MNGESIETKIREKMAGKRITQRKLAKKMGVSTTTINRIINDPDSARFGDIRRIFRILGITLNME